MATTNDVNALRSSLRGGGGALVDRWVATADDYFRRVLRVNPLEPMHLEYVRGIDFHRSVTVEQLRPWRAAGPFPGNFRREHSAGAAQTVSVLRDTRIDAVASWLEHGRNHNRSRLGGDRQVIVPWSTSVNLLRERDFDRQKIAQMWRAGYLPLGLP